MKKNVKLLLRFGFLCLYFCLSVSFIYAENLNVYNGEKFIYEVTNSEDEVFNTTTTYFVKQENGEKLYSYTNKDKYETWNVTTDVQGVPKNITYQAYGNTLTLDFEGTGDVTMQGYYGGEQIDKTGNFAANVSLENALILRTMDLDKGNKYVFDLLQTDKFPELKAYKMYFKVLGTETVQVEAGEFECKKVLFSLTGFRGLFYKAYYYVTDDENKYLVKMENMPKGGSSELISVQTESETQ